MMDVVHNVILTDAEIFRRGINEYIYILCPAENVISGKWFNSEVFR